MTTSPSSPPLVDRPPAPVRRGPGLAVAAMAVTVLLWASAFVAIRDLGSEVSPGPLTLGRLAVGSLVLGLLLLLRAPGAARRAAAAAPAVEPGAPPAPRVRTWPVGRDLGRLAVVGVLWFGVYNVALNAAEQRVDAGTAAMLVNVAPLFLAVLAGLRLGEGFPRPLVVGSLIGFAGVSVIAVATSTGASADAWGVVLCVLAAAAYAVAVVAQKPVLERVSALHVTWVACTIGVVACLPFLPTLVSELARADAGTVAGVVYLGLGPTAIAFTTWAYALARTSAGRLGATTYLVPPIAVLLGWVLLGEVPPVLALAGGALCLVGVSLTRRTSLPGAGRRGGRGRTAVAATGRD